MIEDHIESDTPQEANITPKNSEGIGVTGKSSIRGVSDASQDPVPTQDSNNYEWVDRGIINVPLKDLPQPEVVDGPEDFNHHISWEDASSATRQLPELQKEVEAGKTGDDFSIQDQAAGVDRAHGKRRVYDLYYGSDPVTLEKDGNTYNIISGRHRIAAGKELGLETIPAHVTEKVKKNV